MMNKKKINHIDTEAEEKVDFESLVNGRVDLDILLDETRLSEFNYDELKEIVQFVDEVDNSQLYEKIIQTIRNKTPKKIRIANIGHRIWSYYYERYLLRIVYLTWIALAYFFIKPSISGFYIIGSNEIPKWSIVTIAGLLILFNIWHAVMAFLESKWNRFFNKTTYFRRNLGIYVFNEDGSRISFTKSVLRSIFKTILLGPLSIVFMEFHPQNRSLHDKILNTYVLRITSSEDIDTMQDEIDVFIKTNY